jgi:hypothetical protein
MDRNVGSFPTKLLVELKKAQADKSWEQYLRTYQYFVRYTMNLDIAKGMLVYHKMGMGKTRVLCSVIELYWKKRNIIVLSPKSLHEQIKNEISNMESIMNLKSGDHKPIKFMSLNSNNLGETISRTSLKSTLLVVDESHNLFRSIINGGKNGHLIYDHIMRENDVKLLFLTGTPLSKHPFELVPCFNMLTGSNLFPSFFNSFMDVFVKDGEIINVELIQNRLLGLVSYVSQELSFNFKVRDDNWFPEELETIVEKIPMSQMQYAAYKLERDKEIIDAKNTKQSKEVSMSMKNKSMGTYYVKSRIVSNYTGNEYTQENSPKLHLISQRIDNAEGPVIVYSEFVEKTLKVLGEYLKLLGYSEYVLNSGVADTEGKRYIIYSGDIDSISRAKFVEVFNSSANINGSIVKAILVSKTGVEGLDLKNIRETHQVEPYWNRARTEQFVARAVRVGSHNALPKEQRQVQPYLYLAVYEHSEDLQEDTDGDKKSIDEKFYNISKYIGDLCDKFRTILQTVCIECNLLNYGNCVMCYPDSNPLFTNIAEDIGVNRCKQKVTTVAVNNLQEVEYNGERYGKDGDNIYKFDTSIDMWVKILKTNPEYYKLIDKVFF